MKTKKELIDQMKASLCCQFSRYDGFRNTIIDENFNLISFEKEIKKIIATWLIDSDLGEIMNILTLQDNMRNEVIKYTHAMNKLK